MDREFYVLAIEHTPIAGVSVQDAAAMLFGNLGPSKAGIDAARNPLQDRSAEVQRALSPASDANSDPSSLTTKTKQTLIGASMYGWLTLSTASFLLIAVASGVAFAKAGAERLRRIFIILCIAAAVGLVWGVFDVLSRYGRQYPPNSLRFAMGGVAVFALLGGIVLGNGLKWWMQVAGGSVVVAALGSAAAIVMLKQGGALQPEFASIIRIAGIFALHSSIGVILLWSARGIRA